MMASPWLSAFVWLFLTPLKGHRAEPELRLCAEVHTETPVVPLGSAVSASCLIADDCPLTRDAQFEVRWHHNHELVPDTVPVNTSTRSSQILINNFFEPSGLLTCSICRDSHCQVVAGLEIRAGYPPSIPQNLSCQTNLTKPQTLQCGWTPGSDTLIPTNYTFHTVLIQRSPTVTHDYVIPPGVNSISIPRTDFPLYNEIQVYVRVQNALGQITTPPLLLDPMEAAKFYPRILSVKPNPGKYGCLTYSWALIASQAWVTVKLEMELRMKPVESSVDSTATEEEKVLIRTARSGNYVELCKLLHGKQYQAQIRVRYQRSPWSEWSNQARGTTLEKAPTGHLDAWLKVSQGASPDFNTVELFWKPSKQFRANGRTISYAVSMAPVTKIPIRCMTKESHCVFKIPKRARKVYLTAENSAGRSRPTEVLVPMNRALPPVSSLRVSPHSDTDLLVRWGGPSSPSPIGYVLECRRLNDAGSSFISFDLLDGNQSSALVSGGIEPYTRYEISVYPRYKEGQGLRQTEVAYSKEKAPSIGPTPKFLGIWHSHAKLSWDEIPVTQRNGIIESYRVFYWKVHSDTQESVQAFPPENHVVLKELTPMTMYKAFIMVSTKGGSVNGSTVTLKTVDRPTFEIVLIGIPACVGIALIFIIITTLANFTNNKWLKRFVWPKIPDPANSSIRKWSTTELLQDSPTQKDPVEPVLVFLSHFSVVDLTEKELEKFIQKNKELWICQDGNPDDPDPDLHSYGSSQTSDPFVPEGTSESVPYATLVFSSPYQSQPPPPPPTYLRSESTQPLLAEEEPHSPSPFSPLLYANVPLQRKEEKEEEEEEEEEDEHVFSKCEDDEGAHKQQCQLWEDFPLLNSLEIKEV